MKEIKVYTAEERKKGCKYDGEVYAHGSEFCIDINCFRCMDGELHAYSGIFL